MRKDPKREAGPAATIRDMEPNPYESPKEFGYQSPGLAASPRPHEPFLTALVATAVVGWVLGAAAVWLTTPIRE
jgi:hypothetical protein